MPDQPTIEISQIEELPEPFDALLQDADAEGFDTMSVLRDEWAAGSNRFERPGEVLMLARVDGKTAGIGGITQDFVEASYLRMRRFYVRPAYRRLGVGRQIALHVLEHARPFNRPIVLHADGPDAEVFWPTLGFVPIDRIHTTHVFRPLR
ncbi:GNAT family N-acetyltransferase [Notoacmeibacter sp. MSK16QG-6]|uniref:GNAT family N-acetyltransferase n=1 Tax=Notoacmeibacter sp. MSK16QG-6 TaxID=2957982 RepID=UPI00209DB0C9|nr:GNAT family N-acetyltransferase [Notoacmeibacter sp. MSK16QG-6]MCP1201111.1 GNAT family N-acetyltransferase [Notoacmeibacter sp. MSK16QG-6]